MSEDEIVQLRKDIAKTGYVTEMLASDIFRRGGWRVVDHSYFLDKDENKGREIDLYGIYEATASNARKSLKMTVGLAIEVKKVASKPWVVLTSDLSQHENIADIFDTSLIRLHIQEIWFARLYENHPVAQSARFGRVSYQAFQKKDGASHESTITPNFAAFVSSFKAASEITSFLRQRSNLTLRDDAQLRTYEVGVVHGLIVLDGKLYEGIVGSGGEVSLEEKRYIPYLFNYSSKEYGTRRILMDIVTLSELPDYIGRYENWIKERVKFCLEEIS